MLLLRVVAPDPLVPAGWDCSWVGLDLQVSALPELTKDLQKYSTISKSFKSRSGVSKKDIFLDNSAGDLNSLNNSGVTGPSREVVPLSAV